MLSSLGMPTCHGRGTVYGLAVHSPRPTVPQPCTVSSVFAPLEATHAQDRRRDAAGQARSSPGTSPPIHPFVRAPHQHSLFFLKTEPPRLPPRPKSNQWAKIVGISKGLSGTSPDTMPQSKSYCWNFRRPVALLSHTLPQCAPLGCRTRKGAHKRRLPTFGHSPRRDRKQADPNNEPAPGPDTHAPPGLTRDRGIFWAQEGRAQLGKHPTHSGHQRACRPLQALNT